jgi:hypothetical protein
LLGSALLSGCNSSGYVLLELLYGSVVFADVGSRNSRSLRAGRDKLTRSGGEPAGASPERPDIFGSDIERNIAKAAASGHGHLSLFDLGGSWRSRRSLGKDSGSRLGIRGIYFVDSPVMFNLENGHVTVPA